MEKVPHELEVEAEPALSLERVSSKITVGVDTSGAPAETAVPSLRSKDVCSEAPVVVERRPGPEEDAELPSNLVKKVSEEMKDLDKSETLVYTTDSSVRISTVSSERRLGCERSLGLDGRPGLVLSVP